MVPIISQLLMFAGIGLLAGLHSACWGAYKDCLYEPFGLAKFVRSLAVGILLAELALIYVTATIPENLHYGVFFAFVVGAERCCTEFMKLFLRQEDQSKYAIPTSFHILTIIVSSPIHKRVSGGMLAAIFLLIIFLSNVYTTPNALVMGVTWGTVGGLLCSIGGAWKDAPFEGFYWRKFLRSIVIGALWGSILGLIRDHSSLLLLSCIGCERMTTEFYKTFIRSHQPGKFRDEKQQFSDWLQKRKILMVPYAITWITFVTAFGIHVLYVN